MTTEGIPATIEEPKKVEKPLTREQKRFQERLKQEVESTYKQMCDRFLDFFTESDNPEGEEMIEKVKQVSAQWRLYCKRKNLIPGLYPAMDNYIDGLLKEYQEAKIPTPKPPPGPADAPELEQRY